MKFLFAALICILSLTSFTNSFADEAAVPHAKWPTEKNRAQIKTLMHRFWGHVETLQKYMSNPEEFNNPKNAPFILQNLKEMTALTKKAKHQSFLNSPNFGFSRKVLENHISEISRVYKSGNKEYARWMLNSTTSICMSCHTQYPTDPAMISLPDVGVGSSFSDAEFLFATRRYESAAQVYRKLISDYPGNKLKGNDLETAIRRLVAFHARIKREPKSGAEELGGVLQNKNLPEYVKKDVTAWRTLFEKWGTEPDPDPKKVSSEDLTKWVNLQFEKTLWDRTVPATDPRTVTYLRVSGILYEYLQLHPKSEITPKILYWLARCEYRLSSNFFYSLGDMYLKGCMRGYPKDPIAKKCYFEYEDNLVMSYTGSRGTYLPPDVDRELKDLRKTVGVKPGEKESTVEEKTKL